MCVELFEEAVIPKASTVYIVSDCLAAIDIVVYQRDVKQRAKEIGRINNALKTLKIGGIKVNITWCPGHADFYYIELADVEAKKMAKKVKKKEVDAPSFVTQSAALKLCETLTIRKHGKDGGIFVRKAGSPKSYSPPSERNFYSLRTGILQFLFVDFSWEILP